MRLSCVLPPSARCWFVSCHFCRACLETLARQTPAHGCHIKGRSALCGARSFCRASRWRAFTEWHAAGLRADRVVHTYQKSSAPETCVSSRASSASSTASHCPDHEGSSPLSLKAGVTKLLFLVQSVTAQAFQPAPTVMSTSRPALRGLCSRCRRPALLGARHRLPWLGGAVRWGDGRPIVHSFPKISQS